MRRRKTGNRNVFSVGTELSARSCPGAAIRSSHPSTSSRQRPKKTRSPRRPLRVNTKFRNAHSPRTQRREFPGKPPPAPPAPPSRTPRTPPPGPGTPAPGEERAREEKREGRSRCLLTHAHVWSPEPQVRPQGRHLVTPTAQQEQRGAQEQVPELANHPQRVLGADLRAVWGDGVNDTTDLGSGF